MPFLGGLIGGGLNLVGGLINGSNAADASKSAANAQITASNNAIDFQRDVLSELRNRLQPYLGVGYGGLARLGDLYGISVDAGGNATYNNNAPYLQPISATVGGPPNPNDPALRSAFTASPGYQYNLDQQGSAIQNSGAARSGAVSGNMLRALQTNASGLASQDWWQNYQAVLGNYASRYGDVQNQRAQTLNSLGALSTMGQSAANPNNTGQFAQMIGGNMINSGNAAAAGIIGAANANAGMVNSFTNAFQPGTGGGNALNYLLQGGGFGSGSGGGAGMFGF